MAGGSVSKVERLAAIYEQCLPHINEVAQSTLARLQPLGFPGFSARTTLTAANERLESVGLPHLNLGQFKTLLTTLGYAAEETTWVPMAGTKYSAWRKLPERCSFDGLGGNAYAQLEGILADEEHENFYSTRLEALRAAEKSDGTVRETEISVEYQDSVDRDYSEISVPAWEVIHQCTHTPNASYKYARRCEAVYEDDDFHDDWDTTNWICEECRREADPEYGEECAQEEEFQRQMDKDD